MIEAADSNAAAQLWFEQSDTSNLTFGRAPARIELHSLLWIYGFGVACRSQLCRCVMPLSEIAISYAWRGARSEPSRSPLGRLFFGTANDFSGLAVEVRLRSEMA